MSLSFWNGFWLILPAIIWNVLFARALIAPGFAADDLVPMPILLLEGGLRVATFAVPILLPLALPLSKTVLSFLVFGYIVYFATWVPHLWQPESAFAQHPLIILGPAITPLIFLLAIAALTQSLAYAAISVGFVAVHVTHILYSFQLLR